MTSNPVQPSHAAYDPQNVFAKILRGELPCEKVYEDDLALVIMDIMPRMDGHCLVIPKTPARNMLDASAEQLTACILAVQKVSRAAVSAFNADGVAIHQANEAAGGQEVFHLHYHIMPRHEGIRPKAPASGMEDPAVLKANAEKIRQALAQ